MSFYEDDLSKWYISANNKHSTFLNQIKDQDLKAKSILYSILENMITLSILDSNLMSMKIQNSLVFGLITIPTKINFIDFLPEMILSTVSNEVKQSSGLGTVSKTQDFKPKGYIDGNSHDCVLLEDYKQMKFPTVALSVKDKSPNNYMVFNNGKKEIWIWIGTYVYNK